MSLEQDLDDVLRVHGALVRARVTAVGRRPDSIAADDARRISYRFERKRTEFLARWSASVAHQDGPKL